MAQRELQKLDLEWNGPDTLRAKRTLEEGLRRPGSLVLQQFAHFVAHPNSQPRYGVVVSDSIGSEFRDNVTLSGHRAAVVRAFEGRIDIGIAPDSLVLGWLTREDDAAYPAIAYELGKHSVGLLIAHIRPDGMLGYSPSHPVEESGTTTSWASDRMHYGLDEATIAERYPKLAIVNQSPSDRV